MQTALHILSLVNELKREVIGSTIVSTEFYKKERAAYVFVKTPSGRLSLGFLYHPHGSGVFLVPASKVHIETREKPWPIFGLDGAVITGVEQFGLDRIFAIDCGTDSKQRIIVEAIGPNGNLWLLDSKGGRRATLRKKDYTEGDLYEPPQLPEKLLPFEIAGDVLAKRLESATPPSLVTYLDKQMAGLNQTLAKEIVARADVDFVPPLDLDNSQWERLADVTRGLAERFRSPETGYLYRLPRGVEAYPFKLKCVDTDPEKYKSLSLAVQAMTSIRQASVEAVDERKTVTAAVARVIKKLERRIEKLRVDVTRAADYEQYKKIGELLQINLATLKKGMTEVTLDDIYIGEGATAKVKLDPALSPSDNAEEYFKKHRKGREGLELLRRRLVISEEELKQLREMDAALDSDFDAASQQYEAELANLLPKEGVRKDGAPRLPYREHTLSTGLTIFIGRDGADNDRTTFEFARPYELWFHAQQCPGSHVVIKYPNKSFVPSKQEIEETAAIAAFHSKAKNDSFVPVVYTERRYVRKPRKAKPGLVTVEREKSVMVAPKKPE